MSAELHLVCDGCGRVVARGPSAIALRAVLARAGGVAGVDGADLCFDCAEHGRRSAMPESEERCRSCGRSEGELHLGECGRERGPGPWPGRRARVAA